ncbi:hypothetical protein BASA83_001903 [Batrachochytrium salamandrivorans]|nr:hypothetical protein BASA83_001903 [Batrachochytrium salamandrivorans]
MPSGEHVEWAADAGHHATILNLGINKTHSKRAFSFSRGSIDMFELSSHKGRGNSQCARLEPQPQTEATSIQ